MHSQLEEHIFMKEPNTLVQTKLLLELKFNFPTNLWGALCLYYQPNKSFQFQRTTEFELHKVLFSHSANNKFPTFLTILPLVIITKIKILFYLQLKLVQIFVLALSPMTDCLTSPTFSFNPKPSDTFHIHLALNPSILSARPPVSRHFSRLHVFLLTNALHHYSTHHNSIQQVLKSCDKNESYTVHNYRFHVMEWTPVNIKVSINYAKESACKIPSDH